MDNVDFKVSKLNEATKNLANVAKEHRKGIAITAGCVTGLALIGATAYVVTKAIRHKFVPLGEDYDDEF